MTANAESRPEPGMKFYVIVWLGLLLIVAVEVVLTYRGLSTGALFGSLLVLAFIEAGLGLMYFMHMKWERRALFLALIPYLIFALLMMNQIWPDAFRLLHLRAATPSP
jgi:cytochrome c oxidase subunit IV